MDLLLAERTICLKIASTERERSAARTLRRAVFCEEQGIFEHDDQDDIDTRALPLIAFFDTQNARAEIIGTVRIHEESSGIWFGSRLAVAKEARHTGVVGSGLIKLAVGIAHAHGCRQFLAHVQQQNVPLFARLHWQSISAVSLHGRPHQLMRADLSHYPKIIDGDTGLRMAAGKP